MLYSLTFLCLSSLVCGVSPEMQHYENLYVYPNLAYCKIAAKTVRADGNTVIGCKNTQNIIEWTNKPL